MNQIIELIRSTLPLNKLPHVVLFADETTIVHSFILENQLCLLKLKDDLLAKLAIDWDPVCT